MPQVTRTKGERCRFQTVEEMAEFIVKGDVALVDAVFCDPLGTWQHCTYAPSQCSVKDLKNGFAFDGSSIRLFTTVEHSDMLMVPDPTTCWIDPFTSHRTLHVVCDICDPTGTPFSRCPRQIAKKAAKSLSELGVADYCIFGPEPEFFVFDHVRFNVGADEVAVEIEGSEAVTNNAAKRGSTVLMGGPNMGNRLASRNMYFPVSPADTAVDMRGDMLLVMQDVGLHIEKHHHEVASGQHELGFTFDKLVATADNVMTYKYIVKNVAKQHMKTATFMPKPVFGQSGSGCHVHQSIWAGGKNLFYDPDAKWGNISKIALHYIAGTLKHAWAILAFTNPTTNSYKRLVPGFEAPCKLVYSKGNRSAAIRIPASGSGCEKSKRFECRFPDGASCPYLAFSVLILAGIDGVLNELVPPEPMDKNIFKLTPEELASIPSTPTCLSQALDALEKDHDFLLRNGVFTKDFIMAYIALKREETRQVLTVPHPREFELYYNV